jgi:glycosyltransferase involved in cell wall biosynthesis
MFSSTDSKAPPNELAVTQPALPHIGVIALVPDEWSERWQPRHQVVSRLAKYFRVVWMQPPHEWREALKFSTRRPFGSVEQLLPGFHVYQSHRWLPHAHRPQWLGARLFQLRLRHAAKVLRKHGCRKIVLYVWRPQFESSLHLLAHDLSCYHIDDEYTFSEVETGIRPDEQRLLKDADEVFIHSPALLQKKGGINPHTDFVPNGVDYAAFSDSKPEPADMSSIPRPRIGYAGYIKNQLDWQLLAQLAHAHPRHSFVFVGARSRQSELDTVLAPLEKMSNVYFLGSKTVAELSAYPQHFDVCIMPYRCNDYTQYIYPLKLHEYLAGGRPVVGSRIRSLEEFADVIGLATNLEEWSSGIEAALRPSSNTKDAMQKRQAVARQYDWDVLVRKIANTMLQRLGEPILHP